MRILRRKTPSFLIFIVLCVILGFVFFNRSCVDVEKLRESVVRIICYDIDGNQIDTASGVIVAHSWEVVTNYRVIAGDAYEFEVIQNNGSKTRVESVIAVSKDLDVALLRLERYLDVEPPEVKSPRFTAEIGDRMIAISNPDGEMSQISEGVYEGFVREDGIEVIRTNAEISHGSNGGALFNNKGQLVGILYKREEWDTYAVDARKAMYELYEDRNRIELTIKDFIYLRNHPASESG